MTEQDVKTADQHQKAMDLASRYLSYKPRTRKELCSHLREKGIDEENISLCADLLEEYHLLDDLQYSRMYIESMMDRGRGMMRIRRELIQKGISQETIEEGLQLIEEVPSEEDMALQQARDAVMGEDIASMDYRQRERLKGRIARRLAGRGFRTEAIYQAITKAAEERLQEQKEESPDERE